MDKRAVALDSKLYIEDKGSIDFSFMDYSSGIPKVEVKIWDHRVSKFTWTGTPEEFWNLILAGMELQKELQKVRKE